jgi:hypothetical protein
MQRERVGWINAWPFLWFHKVKRTCTGCLHDRFRVTHKETFLPRKENKAARGMCFYPLAMSQTHTLAEQPCYIHTVVSSQQLYYGLFLFFLNWHSNYFLCDTLDWPTATHMHICFEPLGFFSLKFLPSLQFQILLCLYLEVIIGCAVWL